MSLDRQFAAVILFLWNVALKEENNLFYIDKILFTVEEKVDFFSIRNTNFNFNIRSSTFYKTVSAAQHVTTACRWGANDAAVLYFCLCCETSLSFHYCHEEKRVRARKHNPVGLFVLCDLFWSLLVGLKLNNTPVYHLSASSFRWDIRCLSSGKLSGTIAPRSSGVTFG